MRLDRGQLADRVLPPTPSSPPEEPDEHERERSEDRARDEQRQVRARLESGGRAQLRHRGIVGHDQHRYAVTGLEAPSRAVRGARELEAQPRTGSLAVASHTQVETRVTAGDSATARPDVYDSRPDLDSAVRQPRELADGLGEEHVREASDQGDAARQPEPDVSALPGPRRTSRQDHGLVGTRDDPRDLRSVVVGPERRGEALEPDSCPASDGRHARSCQDVVAARRARLERPDDQGGARVHEDALAVWQDDPERAALDVAARLFLGAGLFIETRIALRAPGTRTERLAIRK